MNEASQAPAESWQDAARWVERSLAEGDPSLRFLIPVITWVSEGEYAHSSWAHPLDWGLAVTLSSTLEGEPCLIVRADDEWPVFDIELRDAADQHVVAWSCDGEDELTATLAEAFGRLRELVRASQARR